jgi:hypothetical protein
VSIPAAPLSTASHRPGAAGFYGPELWCAPVVREAPPDDHQGMSLFDKSPGGGIVVANVFLYGTVLTETWMLTTGSLFVMGLVMALIIVMAGLLCRYVMNLMGSEEYALGEETAVAVVPVAAPAPARRVAVPTAAATPVVG